jgi:hypothetical protein
VAVYILLFSVKRLYCIYIHISAYVLADGVGYVRLGSD